MRKRVLTLFVAFVSVTGLGGCFSTTRHIHHHHDPVEVPSACVCACGHNHAAAWCDACRVCRATYHYH